MIGILQELLYSKPSVTEEHMRTGRYEPILHRMKPELDSLWVWIAGDLPPSWPPQSTGEYLTPDELREILWRIEHDYVRWVGCGARS